MNIEIGNKYESNNKNYYKPPIKYIAKSITIKDFSKYSEINKVRNEVFILCKSTSHDVWIPSRLTHYLKTMCGNTSENTKVKEASTICSFLNYINEEICLGYNNTFNNLVENGLCNLNFYHLAEYLNSFRDKVKYSTVKSKENILIKFYDYLYKIGITGDESKIEQVPAPVNNSHNRNEVKWLRVNPFVGNPNYIIDYPDTERTNSEVLKDMNEDVWIAFLELARKKYPHIALGVAFQICGGIRQGEVVNLTIDSITLNKTKNYIELDIDDRQHQLFVKRSINTRYSQVKKIRSEQPVFNFTGDIFNIWEEHLAYLEKLQNRKDFSALFLNKRGEPMTGEVYQKEFHRLKWEFINNIEETNPSLAEELKIKSWGSHIGRHIFTNHLIKKGYLKNIIGYSDPKLLMILRGDSSTKSSEVYLDLKTITETVASEIDVISSIATSMKK